MLLLVNTTDKLQLVTGSAVTVDVHASWVDYASGSATPGKTNTAISTATTTDIVAAPAASTQRNVKTLNIRNKHASSSVDVTVLYDDNGTDYELIKMSLAAGDVLEYVEGVGWFKVPNPVDVPNPSVSTAQQNIGASTTVYLTNSDLRVSSGRPLKAGTVMRWLVYFAKTGAATATMTFDLRVGTNGTTADTSRGSIATGTQSAVADQALLIVQCVVRSISATSPVSVGWQIVHNLASTGLGPTNGITALATSGNFDTTSTSLIFGLSLTTGASHSINIEQVVAEFVRGTI